MLLGTGSIALFSLGVRAQQPVDTIQTYSRLVILDVRVVDAKGNFVPNLDRSQFTVLEDKVPQTIRNFEAPVDRADRPARIVHSTADLKKTGDAPVNVLVIDELNTAFADTARAQQAMRRFLESQPETLPVPTLFIASGASRIAVLHDFTQSREELLQGLKQHVTDVDFRALSNQLAGGTMSATSGFTKTLGALLQLANSLRGIPGRKNVIWVGSGFDNAYDLTSAGTNDGQKILDAVRLVTQRMMESRISLSTLDPTGPGVIKGLSDDDTEAELLVSGGPNTFSDFSINISFDELADSTGGTVVRGRNDLDHLIGQSTGDANNYYTLTYVPSSDSSEAAPYRKISIIMKDPSLRAFTRTGYFSGGAKEAPVVPDKPKLQTREFKYDMLSAGGSRMVYTGLHVGAKPVVDGFSIMVQAGDLQWNQQDDGTRVAEVSILTGAFNGKDKTLLQQAMEYKQRIQYSDNVREKLVSFHVLFRPPQGTTRTRFVVRDAATGKIGSADLLNK